MSPMFLFIVGPKIFILRHNWMKCGVTQHNPWFISFLTINSQKVIFREMVTTMFCLVRYRGNLSIYYFCQVFMLHHGDNSELKMSTSSEKPPELKLQVLPVQSMLQG